MNVKTKHDRRPFLASALVAMLAMGAQPAAAQSEFTLELTAFKQAVAESLGERDAVAAFYRARDFAPLWTGAAPEHAERRLALFEALDRAGDHALPVARYRADRLLAQLRDARTDRARGLAEMALTETFLLYARDLQSGVLEPSAVDSHIKRTRPERDAQMLLARLDAEDPRAVMRSLIPQTAEYGRLMRAKLQLEHRIAQGGWGAPVPAGGLAPGDAGSAVVALRNRLIAMGYLESHLGTRYDDRIEAAVMAFQADHGLEPDGTAGRATMRQINVAPDERLRAVMVAMERERWTNFVEGRGDRHVLVNLVDFHAQIIDDDKLTFKTKSVIGHQDADRQTVEFSDVMDHMVINPYWWVPRSIINADYLPALRANPYSLSHLQVVDASGNIVSRNQSFARFTSRTFPYNIRQPPGPNNALGSVKFMFPNKYNIYLHDTPSQHLFAEEVRTFSHGCIRLDDPHEFAYALLARQVADPEPYFQSILRTGDRTRVDLETPIPVHLIYRTAFTHAKGKVQYRDDVYGRDATIWRALSAAGVALRVGQS